MRVFIPAVVLALAFSASAQEISLPREQWLTNLQPMLTNFFCSDGSPFRQVYKGKAAECPAEVGTLFVKCTTKVPEVIIPETIVGPAQGNKYGSIVGECMSAHYMGGEPLRVFNALQAVANETPQTLTTVADSCESAPGGAVVELDEPYSEWASIKCDDLQQAHFLVPGNGYAWTVEQNGGFSPQHRSESSYKFSAFGPVPIVFFSSPPSGPQPHKFHFVRSVPSVMTEEQLAGVNQLLPESVTPYKTIHQLDLNTNRGLIYSFFIYLKDTSPEWIVACVNYNCQSRAIVRVSKRVGG